MKETTPLTATVETNCKCWFPFRKAYEKRQERLLKTIDAAQTETYDPPHFGPFNDFRSVSVREEESQRPASPEKKVVDNEESKGTPALEWEAFEEAVARITKGRSENATGSVRSDPLPVISKGDRDEGWTFPSRLPSLGTKHLPPSEADAASTANEETSVFSGSVFGGVSVVTTDTPARGYPVTSLIELTDAPPLELAVSVEEESLAARSHRSIKSHRSTASKSHRSTGSRSQRSTASKSLRSTASSKSKRSTTKAVSRPVTPDVSNRIVASLSKEEKEDEPMRTVDQFESLAVFAVEVEEEKKEDDDKSAALLQTLAKNQNSWSTISVNSRMDASSVLKSLSYSFSHGSSGSSSNKVASAMLPVPPAVNRSKAVEQSALAKEVKISEPPVLNCDRQLAIKEALLASQAQTKVDAAAVAPVVKEAHRFMADEISDAGDTHSQYESSTVSSDDRYHIRNARSDAESTAYSDVYSEGDSGSSKSEDSGSVGYLSLNRKAGRRELQLPVPKEEDNDHSFEALEMQEEDFLKNQDQVQPMSRKDHDKYAEDDGEDGTRVDDEHVHEADDEQDDDDEYDNYSTDNGGASYVSRDASHATETLNGDYDDDDDGEEDNPSFGRELSEMAEELTRGGPGVLIDWLALRSTS